MKQIEERIMGLIEILETLEVGTIKQITEKTLINNLRIFRTCNNFQGVEKSNDFIKNKLSDLKITY